MALDIALGILLAVALVMLGAFLFYVGIWALMFGWPLALGWWLGGQSVGMGAELLWLGWLAWCWRRDT